jgi:hypothetical protein
MTLTQCARKSPQEQYTIHLIIEYSGKEARILAQKLFDQNICESYT